jgi:zinc protease
VVNLTINGAPEDLESGFQLAYLLLTEPKIESASFDQFLTSSKEMLEQSQLGPTQVGGRTFGSIIYPESEARTRPLEARDLDHLSLAASQAWLDKLVKESPIEVVIVGDIEREKAMDLVTRYLGSLPTRMRVEPTIYESLRHLKRPTGPRIAEKTLDTPTKQAYVAVGFYGTDDSKRDDARALTMAARVLSMRMTKEVREEAQLVYSIGAQSRAANIYPGFGVFAASAPTDPSKAKALVAKLRSMYDEFAANGPTDEELAKAKKQFATDFEQNYKEPSFWSGRLAQMTFRGAKLEDIINDPKAYEAMTAAQVKDTFKRYCTPDSMIQVVVTPNESKAEQTPGG